jgi:hypothetical protein
MTYTHRAFVAGAKSTKIALKSQGSAVGIATRYGLGSRSSIPGGARYFYFLHSV